MPRILGALLLALPLAAGLLPPAALAQRGAPPLLAVRGADIPVSLQEATLAIDIGGGMAETTIELRFHNPNARVLEGELQFPLAPGQRVIGFALDLGGAMRPAVPVEKARGRQVFEQIERRGVDPALLEMTQGDYFKLRIYPIPARGERRVRLQLAQALPRGGGRWSYRLPLPYAAGAERLDATVGVHGATAAPHVEDALAQVAFEKTADGYRASLPRTLLAAGSLAVTGEAERTARAWVGDFGDESYFHAEIPIETAGAPRSLPRAIGLLWDSSSSGAARDHAREFALLDRYFRAAGDIEVRLTRLRDRAEAPRSFPVHAGDWTALRRELEATAYDGATALDGWAPERQVGEYLLFSDGLVNYGPRSFPSLLHGQRLFALDAAPGADSARLRGLAQRNGGRLIHISSGGQDSVDAAARALLNDGPRIAAMEGEGLAELQAESTEPVDGVLHIAGRRLRPDALLRVRMAGPGAVAAPIELPVGAALPRQPLAPLLWAGWRIDALQADETFKRSEIARLAKRFGIATRGTSLIVLDRLEDYVRYDIAPPPELRRAFEQMKALRGGERDAARGAHLERVVRELEAELAWWKTAYPKDAPPRHATSKPREDAMPPPPPAAPQSGNGSSAKQALLTLNYAAPAPSPAPAPPAADGIMRRSGNAVQVSGSRIAANTGSAGSAADGIALRKWTPDERHVERMRRATAEDAYAIYLDQKPDFANSTGFYLDVADLLFEKGRRDLALRVLSNLAELDFENRHILRILGYRLLQAGAPDLAASVFEDVLRLAEDEPQSWRDLGLAYAAVGRPQDAADTLYQVAVRDWDPRFSDVELITLADLDAVIAANPGKIDTGRMDPRLLRHMPLDLRAVLTWDADNSDMDLWVTDPNGERCYYMNRATYQGGRMSRDATGGYGPEEFSLRFAKPGKYKVEANFYGHRQQVVASATTLQLKLTTGFGTPRATERLVTLRLRGAGETVFVGEFEVPATVPATAPARRR